MRQCRRVWGRPGGAVRRIRTPLAAALLFAALPLHAQSPAVAAPSRGELLYATHCIACHTTQVHWRDRRLVLDYPSLVAQVVRWQGNTGLGWTGEEVREVARYLDATFYHLPDAPQAQRG
jgi:mono/diheme cytochrome c family protein